MVESHFPNERQSPFLWVGSTKQKKRLSRYPSKMKPEWLILGDWESFSWNLEYLNNLVNVLRQGAQLATLSPSLYYVSKSGWRLDTGSLVRLLEPYLETPINVLGKPNPLLIEAARRKLGGHSKSPQIVIGDDASTDIQMALKSETLSVLLRQGKYRPGDEANFPPTWCVKNLVELIPILESWFLNFAGKDSK